MNTTALFVLMAAYNRAMNEKVYAAAARLPAAQLQADRGAFFGSVIGTLNHLLVGDTIWLQRFATHPAGHSALAPLRAAPAGWALDSIVEAELAPLAQRRAALDAIIADWAAQLVEADLDHLLAYRNTKGVPAQRQMGSLVQHFFNHQTHHRGQASTLLSQAGQDIGVTDLLALIPDQSSP